MNKHIPSCKIKQSLQQSIHEKTPTFIHIPRSSEKSCGFEDLGEKQHILLQYREQSNFAFPFNSLFVALWRLPKVIKPKYSKNSLILWHTKCDLWVLAPILTFMLFNFIVWTLQYDAMYKYENKAQFVQKQKSTRLIWVFIVLKIYNFEDYLSLE